MEKRRGTIVEKRRGRIIEEIRGRAIVAFLEFMVFFVFFRWGGTPKWATRVARGVGRFLTFQLVLGGTNN